MKLKIWRVSCRDMHERIFHFDIIRTVACLMVIIMHAPMPSDRIIGVFTLGYYLFNDALYRSVFCIIRSFTSTC